MTTTGNTTTKQQPGAELVPADQFTVPVWLTQRGFPEIVIERQPSIAELIAAARTPRPGEATPAGWRIGWIYAIAIPAKVLGATIGWAGEEPGKTAGGLVALFAVGTLLAEQPFLPFLAWIVPSFFDVTTWF
jgi:hypothetical protein